MGHSEKQSLSDTVTHNYETGIVTRHVTDGNQRLETTTHHVTASLGSFVAQQLEDLPQGPTSTDELREAGFTVTDAQ